jgi:hypothetical protein
MNKLLVDNELRTILHAILSEKKSLEEWAEIESDEYFQTDRYVGGFDATEMAFCFSLFDSGNEYWFQFFLEQIEDLLGVDESDINIRPRPV